MTIESARRIDAYYAAMSERHPSIITMQSHMSRWERARAFLVKNDPGYVWES